MSNTGAGNFSLGGPSTQNEQSSSNMYSTYADFNPIYHANKRVMPLTPRALSRNNVPEVRKLKCFICNLEIINF